MYGGDATVDVRSPVHAQHLTRQRRSVAVVCREIIRQCRARGLKAASRGTVLRRIAQLDPVTATSVQGRRRRGPGVFGGSEDADVAGGFGH